MARKKIEPIISLGKEDKLTVQKSLPLFALWRSDLTLPEFKILDTYLSRINSRKPERRVVIFEKGELEKILGVQKINIQDLKARLKHLMGNVVEVPDSSSKKGFRLVSLFEEAIAEQDEYGLWKVKLECTQKAMKYFFNVENIGYLRYKLRCITSLTSRYTYIMFTYLERNRWRKSWEVELDELKAILHCDNEETYKEFKRFNDRLLKRVQKEMHEKTECQYSYEPIKKGRSVTAIRFTVATLADEITQSPDVIPGQLPLDDAAAPLLQSACSDEFTGAELDAIEAILRDANIEAGQYGIEIARFHWLEKAYKEFLVAADRAEKAGKPIKHRFTYFKKMLEQRGSEV